MKGRGGLLDKGKTVSDSPFTTAVTKKIDPSCRNFRATSMWKKEEAISTKMSLIEKLPVKNSLKHYMLSIRREERDKSYDLPLIYLFFRKHL
jgi:hypothetical protein